jgi:hypothetical protein
MRMRLSFAYCLPLLLVAGMADAAQKKKMPSPRAADPAPMMSVDGLPIGNIPRQQLAPGKCAAFLWTQSPSHALVAMISSDPPFIRYAPGGVVTDLARTAMGGDGKFGISTQGSFAGGDATIDIDLTMEDRADIKDGAAIPSGTLSIGKAGADTVVVPVAGLVGCG